MLELTTSNNPATNITESAANNGNGQHLQTPYQTGFAERHIGPNSDEIQQMLTTLGMSSLKIV